MSEYVRLGLSVLATLMICLGFYGYLITWFYRKEEREKKGR